MKRLFTFGCSYTRFFWPTWADILSIDYDYYENWGVPGIGNRGIMERLSECHVRNRLNKDDTVVIQWSTYLRFDWHNLTAINGMFPGWQTRGNMFSKHNGKVFNEQMIQTFCSEFSMLMHSLNNINSAIEFLNSIGCDWYFTGIGDLRYLGADLDQDTRSYEAGLYQETIETGNFPLYEHYPELSIYDKIWSDHREKWCEPLNYTAQCNPDLYWWFQADSDKEPWYEPHPSSPQHYLWLKNHLYPRLDISDDNRKQSVIDKIQEIKDRNLDCLKFEDLMLNKAVNGELKEYMPNWPSRYRGF